MAEFGRTIAALHSFTTAKRARKCSISRLRRHGCRAAAVARRGSPSRRPDRAGHRSTASGRGRGDATAPAGLPRGLDSRARARARSAFARLAALEARATRHAPSVPTLDADGVLRFDTAWVSLPPVEARLTRALVDASARSSAARRLLRPGGPKAPPGRNALDVHVLRLRRRLAAVGLVIRTVRSRGYLLEAAARPPRCAIQA